MRKNSVTPDAEKVRTLRLNKGWTQSDLAGHSGYAVRTIAKIEMGRAVYARTLGKVALALGVETEQLLMNNHQLPSAESDCSETCGVGDDQLDGGGTSRKDDTVSVKTGCVDVEIRLRKPFDEFSEAEEQQLYDLVKRVLGRKQIKSSKRRGSIVFTFEDLSPEEAERLKWAALGDEFDAFGVEEVVVLGSTRQSLEGRRDGTTGQVTTGSQGVRRSKIARPFHQLFAGSRSSPVLWSLTDRATQERKLIARLFSRQKSRSVSGLVKLLRQWLASPFPEEVTLTTSLEHLAWCYSLPNLYAMPDEPLQRLRERLADFLDFSLDRVSAALLDERPITHQLTLGEYPLAAAAYLYGNSRWDELSPDACRTLEVGIVDLLDGEGLINCKHLHCVRPLLGCWTRAIRVGGALGIRPLGDAGYIQYQWLVRQAIRLSRSDGRQVLTDGAAGEWQRDLFAEALAISDDSADWQIASHVLPRFEAVRKTTTTLPSEAVRSEWAEIAVGRTQWKANAEQFAVAYGGRKTRSEFSIGSQTVWSGGWGIDLKVDGSVVSQSTDWEEVCWLSDADLHYLELEASFSDGWRVQRQMIVAREDHFVLVCDALLGEEPGRIEYKSTIPLVADVRFEPDAETREGILVTRRPITRVMPLAAPEWRATPSSVELSTSENGLVTSYDCAGQRAYMPLFFDVQGSRLARPFTWRQLTVAQNLEVQNSEAAVGYRVQIGKSQWLIYRSLSNTANRTVLGQNLSSEFVLARIQKDGNTEKLIEIE